MRILRLPLAIFAVFTMACTTTGVFKVPANTKLVVTDRVANVNENGEWVTSPFFWNNASGARFRLYDKNDKIIRSGKLKTHFRPASIFWPPGAIIYWPLGLQKGVTYDLTKKGDGYYVREDATPDSSGPPIAPAKK